MLAALIPACLMVVWMAVRVAWKRWGNSIPGSNAEFIGENGPGPGEALLYSAVICGLWLVLGTEVLGAFKAIDRVPIALWWGVPTLAIGIWVATQAAALKGWIRLSMPQGISAKVCLLIIVAVTLTALVVAVLSPPNNWDSMTYHLPRQVMWMTQHTLDFWPVQNQRQIAYPPFAEYAGLNLMVLSGGDHWANLVQWFALPLAMIAAALTARVLTDDRLAEWFAAVFVCTSPIVYAWATNTKNDLILGAQLAIVLYIGVKIWSSRSCSWPRALLLGATLGLALLTKSSAYLVAPPLCLWLAWGMLRASPVKALVKGAVLGAVALAILAPHSARMHAIYGNFFGPQNPAEGGYSVISESFSPSAMTLEVIRNVALNTATPSPEFNKRQEQWVESAHSALGWTSNDTRIMYVDAVLDPHFKVQFSTTVEDMFGGPLQMLLFLAATLCALGGPWLIRRPLYWSTTLVVFACFFMICIMLKWTVYSQRYHIIIWCLAAAPVACLLTVRPLRWTMLPLSIGLAAVLFPFATSMLRRPLQGDRSVLTTPRDVLQYSADYPELMGADRRVAAMAREAGARTIGIYEHTDNVAWYYPLQRRMLEALGPDARFTVFNGSYPAKLKGKDPAPDLVVSLADPAPILVHNGSGKRYAPVAQDRGYTVYVPIDAPRKMFMRTPDEALFIGWERSEGLAPTEFGDPNADHPSLRVAQPRSRLMFTADGRPVTIVLRILSIAVPDLPPVRKMKILINGTEAAVWPFAPANPGPGWQLTVPTKVGENTLEIIFDEGASPPASFGAIFGRFQILSRGQVLPNLKLPPTNIRDTTAQSP